MNEQQGHQPGDSHPAGLHDRYSVLERVFRMARKELREILRDRRTVITLVAMPLLLYPLMSVAFHQFHLASSLVPEQTPAFNVGTVTSHEAGEFERRFELGQKAWWRAQGKSKRPKSMPRLSWTVGPQAFESFEAHKALDATMKGGALTSLDFPSDAERATVRAQLHHALREGKLDLVIEIPTLRPRQNTEPRNLLHPAEVTYMANSAVGRAALEHIETMFAAINEENLQERLNVRIVPRTLPLLIASTVGLMSSPLGAAPLVTASSAPIPERGVPRINLVRLQAAPLGSSGGMISLAALVPLILLLMTITGAVYPAIDLTAGERERGTLEILVAAPVSRFELLAAKYITVVTVAVMTAIVNLICMAITVSWSGLAAVLIREGGFTFTLLLQLFALLLLFAGFFSAVLLCLTSFARSFKEAQAYLIPLMLGSLTPGILAMMPGLKLQGLLTVLPLVNIVLLARDLFEATGETGISPIVVTIVILTTMLYSLAALSLAARVFGAETVLYSEQSSWSELLRRPDVPQPVATIPAVLWCLALMIPVQFVLHTLMMNLNLQDAVMKIVMSVVVNILLFGLLPMLFISRERVALNTGLGLAWPHPASLGAGLLLGVSLWPLELYMLSHTGVSRVLEERYGAVLLDLAQARATIGWIVLAIVVVPAVLEELFFRGLLQSALRARAGVLVTIGANGLLFGVTHVVLGGALGLDRLLPSLVLGLILSTVCWRAGSVWPCVLQHVLHNAILVIVGLTGGGTTRAVPDSWLIWGAIGTLAGGGLLLLANGHRGAEAERNRRKEREISVPPSP